MSPLVYWILFSILVGLLVIFLSCIIFNLILDHCLTQPVESQLKANHSDTAEEAEDARRLNKYQFDKHDVEDLTRMQGDFKTVLPNVSFTNEVDDSNLNRLLKDNERSHDTLASSLSNLDEEDGKYDSGDIDRPVAETASSNIKEKKQISKSVDDLEFCDPRGIDVLRIINRIEEKARNVEKEMEYFVGGTNNMKFYEINEKLLRLMIALCDVLCETAELQKRKTEILEYIEECQRKLKQKAISM